MSREHWDERYGTEELIWKADPNRFLVEELQALAPGRALDVACGEGRNAVWLASKGWHVTGVDFSRAGLAKAQRTGDGPRRGSGLGRGRCRRVAASFGLVRCRCRAVPAPSGRATPPGTCACRGRLAPGGILLVVGHDVSNLLKEPVGHKTRQSCSGRSRSSRTSPASDRAG